MRSKIVPIITFFAMILFSCDDSTFREYRGNSPVYMTYDNLRASVTTLPASQLKKIGKIYFKDNFIFIVEEMQGIHIFDNSNPSLPINKSFLNVPGVVDISISGSTLYADSFVDLVAIDVSNINDAHETGRVKDVLPYTIPATGNDLPIAAVDTRKGVVTGWEQKTIRERVENIVYPIYDLETAYSNASYTKNYSGVSGSGIGAGGSMARFGIKGNILYVVNSSILSVFDITSKSSPVKYSNVYPGGWDIETMFLTDNNMFLGTRTGMIILDLSVPLTPSFITFFQHVRSCDPVVVDDTLAYVTLRTGTTCGGSGNTLDVVNIKKLNAPVTIATYPMTSPYGLGKDGDLLFVCDGDAGLKIFDASDPKTISGHLLFTYGDINSYDVIPVNNVLILVGEDGLFQYDYSNVLNIHLLSSLFVTK
jgi:hypothetical protein